MNTVHHQIGERVKENFSHPGDLLFHRKDDYCRVMSNRIKEIRELKGYTLQKLQDATGISLQQLSRLELGQRRINQDNLQVMANALGVSISELLGEEDEKQQIPIVGYAEGSEEYLPINSNNEDMKFVEFPVISRTDLLVRDLMAVKVKGDSMRPLMKDGWIIYFMRRKQQGIADNCLRNLCVVKLKNGHAYIKELRKGSKPNRYTLLSYGNQYDPLEDVDIEWASRVISFQSPKF